MMPKTRDLAETFGMEVLRQLVNKTQGEKFFRVECGPKTQILGYVHADPFVIDFPTKGGGCFEFELDAFLQPVAKALLLQIREGSFEKICDLPLPNGGPFEYYNWRDPESNLAVRSFRFFDHESGKMFTKFEIGVEQ